MIEEIMFSSSIDGSKLHVSDRETMRMVRVLFYNNSVIKDLKEQIENRYQISETLKRKILNKMKTEDKKIEDKEYPPLRRRHDYKTGIMNDIIKVMDSKKPKSKSQIIEELRQRGVVINQNTLNTYLTSSPKFKRGWVLMD